MLTELALQQFKAHEDTRIPLDRLTVLVGPNASGKTSALDALRYLSLAARMPVSEALADKGDGRWLVRQGPTGPMKLACAGVTGPRRWTFDVTVPSSGDLGEASFNGSTEPAEDLPNIPRRLLNSHRPLAVREALRSTAFLRLEARRLGVPSYSDQEVPALAEDGYGLATVLSTLKLTATDRFRALEDAARRIIPRLRGLGFKRTKLEEQRPRALTVEGQKVVVDEKTTIIADELLLDFDDASGLPAHVASEGTLVVLGILAALYAPVKPGLVLLDDLDRALHPKAQRDLVGALRAALDAMPEAQIVATSHSPYLVDELSPEQVVVLGRVEGGPLAAKRLADHPKANLLDVLTTGEFWAAEGEDWVAAR